MKTLEERLIKALGDLAIDDMDNSIYHLLIDNALTGLKQELTSLCEEVIGEDETYGNASPIIGASHRIRIDGRNALRSEQRQRLRRLVK